MRRLLTLLAFAALCAPLAQAQVHSDQETKADIERHRAMAAATPQRRSAWSLAKTPSSA